MIIDIDVSVDPEGRTTFLRNGTVAPPSATRPLNVLVCGGREFSDELVSNVVEIPSRRSNSLGGDLLLGTHRQLG